MVTARKTPGKGQQQSEKDFAIANFCSRKRLDFSSQSYNDPLHQSGDIFFPGRTCCVFSKFEIYRKAHSCISELEF